MQSGYFSICLAFVNKIKQTNKIIKMEKKGVVGRIYFLIIILFICVVVASAVYKYIKIMTKNRAFPLTWNYVVILPFANMLLCSSNMLLVSQLCAQQTCKK